MGRDRHRDALMAVAWQVREAFTAMLVAANAYYFRLARRPAEDARAIPKPSRSDPGHVGPRRHDLQRLTLHDCARARWRCAKALQPVGAAREPHRAVAQYHRCQQAEAIGAIANCRSRCARERSAETFDRTPRRYIPQGAVHRRDFSRHHHYRGRVIALSIRLPLQHIMAAMHASQPAIDRQVQGTTAKDEVRRDGRAGGVPRNAIASARRGRAATSKEKGEGARSNWNAAPQNLIYAERLAALAAWSPALPRSQQPDRHQPDGGLDFARRAEMFDAS